MKRLLGLFLGLSLLAACTQPGSPNAPVLKPQFGSAANDKPADVTFASNGNIFVASTRVYQEPRREDGWDYTANGTQVILQRFDRSGNFVWSRTLASYECPDYLDECTYEAQVVGSKSDSSGNIYVLMNRPHWAYDVPNSEDILYKYSSGGALLWKKLVGRAYHGSVGFTVDSNGNSYIVREDDSYYYDFSIDDIVHATGRYISKHASNGARLWQRSLNVGTPKDVTVSSSGSIYAVGTKGMARYTNSGNLSWTKPGNFEQVMVSGSNVYTRYRKDVRKYDDTGKQLWYRAQSGLNTLVLQDMVGDGNGNVYLSGKYQVSGPNWNAMVRKLNSSGSALWTKTYGTPAYDDAKGIATINGSEIYTTGLTKGSLAHTNIGGEDGYLRKLNSSGNPLWTR